jgi:hypothetical protein
MICHEYKCIFIHVPKVAGTSIITAFNKKWDKNDNDMLFLLGGNCTENVNEWDIYKNRYSDYIKFTSVRNPWDRFISGWKYCNSTKNKPLIDVLNDLPKRENNPHDHDHLTRLQTDIIYNNKNELLVDFIIRYENLQGDFDNLCDLIKKPKTKLPLLNTTEHNHYKEYFDENSNYIFSHIYKKDIVNLNYIF